MKKIIFAFLLTLLLGFFSSIDTEEFTSFAFGENNLQRDQPQTVPHVDLERYMGTWHEIASTQPWFERGCEKTYSDFQMTADGSIKIDNYCYKQGLKHDAVGSAFPDPKDTEHSNAKLKLKMPPYPGTGDYWIVRLDESYSYAVVSSPDYHYLWINYRAPVMPEELYQSIVEDLRKDGFHVQKLKKTHQ